jgi:predicted MFS family arabinose efflux permease
VLAGYLEMSMGVGMTVGAALGSFVFTYVGYAGTYYFFAAFVMVFGVITVLVTPFKLESELGTLRREER